MNIKYILFRICINRGDYIVLVCTFIFIGNSYKFYKTIGILFIFFLLN